MAKQPMPFVLVYSGAVVNLAEYRTNSDCLLGEVHCTIHVTGMPPFLDVVIPVKMTPGEEMHTAPVEVLTPTNYDGPQPVLNHFHDSVRAYFQEIFVVPGALLEFNEQCENVRVKNFRVQRLKAEVVPVAEDGRQAW